MPRPRLSYDHARMTGALDTNRGRFEDRKTAPTTSGELGPAPSYFDDDTAAVWDELSQLIPDGVAGTADRIAVELTARLLFQFRTDPDMQGQRIATLMQLLSRLGMEPQARTKMAVPQPEQSLPDDEWTSLTPNAVRTMPLV